MKKINKGFTLIELLVVIAIIGILSSVVLASLNTARQKGVDAKIQSQLGAMRAQAELYSGTITTIAGTGGSANVGCSSSGIFSSSNNGLGNLLGGLNLPTTACISNSDGRWAVSSQLSSGYWCVDSTGVSRSKTSGGTNYNALSGASSPAAIVNGAYVCS